MTAWRIQFASVSQFRKSYDTMDPLEIWYGNSISSALIRTLLLPFTGLYTAGWETYLAIYKLGLKQAKFPHPNVICVGNLVAGGSGKSPVTLHVAQVLKERGHSVTIGCSGYGSPRSEAATLAPGGELDPAEWGDEPAMMRWLAPEFPIVVGRRRVFAAKLAYEHDPEGVLVMDDGFQHMPLGRKVDIVLDEPNPDNAFCFPSGPYREPRWNKKRAQMVLPNENFLIEYSPTTFLHPDRSLAQKPRRVNVLCALGQPQRLIESLNFQGIEITNTGFLPDHDPMSQNGLFDVFSNDDSIVVTAKDWVKLKKRVDLPEKLLIATREASIKPESFGAWLQEQVNH